MTEQKQLKASPLQIERYEFLEVAVKAKNTLDTLDTADISRPLSLTVHREWVEAEDSPRRWRILLTVRFGDEKDGMESIYSGHLLVAGYFRVVEPYPEEKMSDLIGVTGASILYGACREMLTNLTARGPHGMISLPSVSFAPALEASNKKPAALTAPTVRPKRIARKTK